MEHVRTGRVVDDDSVGQVAVKQGQVLDVVTLVKDTRFTEQSRPDGLVWVEQVQKWVGVFVQGGCVDDDLVVFCHFNKEFVDSRSLHDVHKVNDVFDL